MHILQDFVASVLFCNFVTILKPEKNMCMLYVSNQVTKARRTYQRVHMAQYISSMKACMAQSVTTYLIGVTPLVK